jgi:hypothetical protein
MPIDAPAGNDKSVETVRVCVVMVEADCRSGKDVLHVMVLISRDEKPRFWKLMVDPVMVDAKATPTKSVDPWAVEYCRAVVEIVEAWSVLLTVRALAVRALVVARVATCSVSVTSVETVAVDREAVETWRVEPTWSVFVVMVEPRRVEKVVLVVEILVTVIVEPREVEKVVLRVLTVEVPRVEFTVRLLAVAVLPVRVVKDTLVAFTVETVRVERTCAALAVAELPRSVV